MPRGAPRRRGAGRPRLSGPDSRHGSKQIDGPAEVIDLPEAVEPLVDYFRAVAGEHSDWAQYRQAMVDQGKCLIRVTPQTWGPVATGGFPPPG